MNNDELSARIDKMERQLHFWRILTFLSLVACATATAASLGADAQSLKAMRVDATAVVAKEFDLVNAGGRVTARLAPDPDNSNLPEFVLKYPNDKPAVHISVNNKTFPSISVLNSDGAPRAMMNESADGPSFSLFDEDDRIRIVLDAGKSGPQISIYDKARKRTLVAFGN